MTYQDMSDAELYDNSDETVKLAEITHLRSELAKEKRYCIDQVESYEIALTRLRQENERLKSF